MIDEELTYSHGHMRGEKPAVEFALLSDGSAAVTYRPAWTAEASKTWTVLLGRARASRRQTPMVSTFRGQHLFLDATRV